MIDVGGAPVGLTVCEDMWKPGPPASEEARAGATLIAQHLRLPLPRGQGHRARAHVRAARPRATAPTSPSAGSSAARTSCVFDGHSFVLDPTGETIARAAQFEEELLVCDVDLDAAGGTPARPEHAPRARRTASGARRRGAAATPSGRRRRGAHRRSRGGRDLRGAVPGPSRLREKNGFRHVVLGLSGGIDSALVACLAVDALGAERVSVAIMPSPYSSARDPRGRARPGRRARRARARAADRAGDGRLRRDARAGDSRTASPTSPRRTSRPASAATC